MKASVMKLKLIGMLEHLEPSKLHLFTVTAGHETASNQIVETLHRLPLDVASNSALSPTISVQTDSCTTEKKSRYIFPYLESLVAWRVFQTVEG